MYPERTHARCPFYRNGKYVWLPVKVLSYNDEEDRYLVKHVENGVQKYVERLSLLFDQEDKNQFKERIYQCKYYQRRAEDEIRFQNYAETIPLEKVSILSQKWIENILQKTLPSRRKVREEEQAMLISGGNRMIKTVEAEYVREMKKLFVLAEMQDKVKKDKFSPMKIELRRDNKMVDYYGTLGELPTMNIQQQLLVTLEKKHLTKIGSIASCLVEFSKKSAEKLNYHLLNYKIPKAQIPMKLQNYINIQQKFHSETKMNLINLWRESQITSIQGGLTSENGFNPSITNEDLREIKDIRKNDMFRIIKRMDMFFRNSVKNMVEQNLELYVEYLKQFTVPNPDEETGAIWVASNKPLITIDIKSKERDKKEEKKEDRKNKDRNFNDLIYFDPPQVDIIKELKSPVYWLIDTVNSICTLECDILRLLNLERKPVYPVDENLPVFKESLEKVEGLVNKGFVQPNEILSQFQMFSYLMKDSADDIVKKYLDKGGDDDVKQEKGGKRPKKTLKELDDYLSKVEKSIRDIQGICTNEKNTIFFQLRTEELKKVLVEKAKRIIEALLRRMESDSKNNIISIQKSFDDLRERMITEPKSVETYVQMRTAIETHEQEIAKFDLEIENVGKYMELQAKYGNKLDNKIYLSYWMLKVCPTEIKFDLKRTKNEEANHKKRFMVEITEEKQRIFKEIHSLEQEFERSKTLTYDVWIKQAEESFNFNSKIETLNKARSVLFDKETLMGDCEPQKFESLDTLIENYEPYRDLREINNDLDTEFGKWLSTPLMKIKFKDVSIKFDATWKKLGQITRRFEVLEDGMDHLKICIEVQERMTKFKQQLPVIKNLTKDAIVKKPVYWAEIFSSSSLNLSAKDKPTQASVTLNNLLAAPYNILDHIPVLDEICTRAEREYNLEQSFNEEIVEVLKKSRLDQKPHKNTGTSIIVGVDDLQMLYEERFNMLIGMKQSPNIKPIRNEVEKMEKKLTGYLDLLDSWVKCQRDWIYLEPIFSSNDMKVKLEEEKKLFDEVDDKWKGIMKELEDLKNLVFEHENWEKLAANLNQCNGNLDKIQKKLNSYLDMNRGIFPRFYFLSDEELLEILSKAKDPTMVTKYMKKCFEAIEYIDFNAKLEVINMKSAEKETVTFLKPVVTSEGDRKGNVEKWLGDVEVMMKDTLISECRKCFIDQTERVKWVFRWPGQVILAINNIRWATGVEENIHKGTLRDYLDVLISERKDIVDMVKGEITPLQRQTLGALIVIDQHAIYVVEMLIRVGIESDKDFDWISQMRYYMGEKDKIKTKMVTSTLPYQYEYLGNSDRLVITPLTDRCYRTLMGAYECNYGGAPEGPAGTGKTETVKDLAKAVAVLCQVFNCSEQINIAAMSKFFKGLSQCGSWCCFDEFNRISPDVLSVIAEQVRTIQTAIREGRTQFLFEGNMCRLQNSAFTCITMNPGYAGRSELPDNLKALFRPCAMMVPDYSLIAEIVLFSYGFQNATPMSKKIVASLRLSSEQLSSQKHYDFGMRALKAILVAAGNLKKKNQTEDEDKLCLLALFDVNLPKFTQNDIPLFKSISNDLFRDVQPPITDYSVLKKQISEECELKTIMPEEIFITKCIQVYETLLVRHGLMLVGQTFSGKTCVLKCLKDSLTKLDGIGSYRRTKDFWINPKAQTSFQLFGKLDQNTKLWTDGVLPVLWEIIENDYENPERKWLIFDGPVDAVWIENLNTVLDDNKILCLTNGRKMKVTPQMNLMFEVEDLNEASPATVSRCGMVYLQPIQLGWKPLVYAYTKFKLVPALKPMQHFLETNLIWFLTGVFAYSKKNCKTPFLVDEMQMITSVLNIFDCFCAHLRDEKHEELNKKESESLINNYCLFSVLWGVGGVIEESSRVGFNNFLLKMVYFDNIRETYNLDLEDDTWEPRGLNYNLNEAKNLYEIVFDLSSGSWMTWLKTVPKWTPPSQSTPYNELIIPTTDTVRNSFFINLMIKNNRHILLTGPTGTAKTVGGLNEILLNYSGKEVGNIMMVFSGQTSPNQIQLMIEAKMTTRLGKKGQYGPEDGKSKMVVFIDDVNMPQKEEYGAQPPIELLRMWADHGYWYDLQDREKRYLNYMQLVCTMGPPSTGKNMITRRFLRHFYILYTEPFDKKSLGTIFSSILDWYFLGLKGKLPSNIIALKDQVVEGTIQVYTRVSAKLLPTPKKSHYMYNLRDISRVIQGVTMANFRSFSDPNDLIKLWAHECMRVFSDRLIDKAGLDIFNEEILKPVTNDVFKKTLNSIVKFEPLLFGSFIPTKYPDDDTTKIAYQNVYCELVHRENLITFSNKHLARYNEAGDDKLNLVLFMAAIEHMVRVVRVLNTSYGHALLVGVGGSGKKSTAKLSTFIAEYEIFQIELRKGYDIKKDWPEDLQKLLKQCGVDNKPTTFLFTDSQIFNQSILEDISSILNQGEVPNLFPMEEKLKITEEIEQLFPSIGETASTSQRFELFIKTCKKNLHLALCFSPVGEAFTKRLRTFPSLINCTTIDWFLPWPNSALKSVAVFLLKDVSLSQDEIGECFRHFCLHARKSGGFDQEVLRRVEEILLYYTDKLHRARQLLQVYACQKVERQPTQSCDLRKRTTKDQKCPRRSYNQEV
jgi:dynein heavy chain